MEPWERQRLEVRRWTLQSYQLLDRDAQLGMVITICGWVKLGWLVSHFTFFGHNWGYKCLK